MALFMPNRNGRLVIAYMVMLSLLGLTAPRVIVADELPKESVLPLSMTYKAVQAALEACKKDGYRVSVAVVDRAGVLRAMGRADGACRAIADGAGPPPCDRIPRTAEKRGRVRARSVRPPKRRSG